MTSLALACRLGAGSPITLPSRVRSILSKFDSSVHIPGVDGVLRFGFSPGNYVESTGQTLSAADAAVGFVVDAARSPGAELAPALADSGDWDVSGTDATHIATWTSSGLRYQSDTTSPVLRVRKFGLIQSDKYYEVVAQIANHVSGGLAVDVGGRRFSIPAGNGMYRRIVDSLGTDTAVTILRDTSNVDLELTYLSVRELPGIHATQATAGFKPVLRNTAGVQSWEFDGVDDRLQLSAVPFQVADNPFCFVAFEAGVVIGNRTLIDLATSASSARFANLRTNGVGQVQSVIVNDASTATLITGETLTEGALRVLHSETFGGVQTLYSDGVFQNQAAIVGSFTPTEGWIGGRKGASEFTNGKIHAVLCGKGTLSASERTTLVKFLASLQGRTL